MLPLRLVLDTNIVVSAAVKPHGLQRTVLLVAGTKPARLYLSASIFSEYRTVLARPEPPIRRAPPLHLLKFIKTPPFFSSPPQSLKIRAAPADNIFLECADAARADYLVAGSQHHFPKFWKKTTIIT